MNWNLDLRIEGISRKWMELIITIISTFVTGMDGTISGGLTEEKK
jgi:hypothetical protein